VLASPVATRLLPGTFPQLFFLWSHLCYLISFISFCAFLVETRYDLAPAQSIPALPLYYGVNGCGEVCPSEVYLRSRADLNQAAADTARVEAIGTALGPEFELLADVAMGEPVGKFPTFPVLEPAAAEAAAAKKAKKAAKAAAAQTTEPVKEEKTKLLEWYGFVRLQVWAQRQTSAGAKLLADRASGNVTTMVVPSGEKITGNDWMAANDDGSSSGNSTKGSSATGQAYAAGLSPDKGAVLAYFPTAKLLCCAAHFHGTNKHGVPEREFDAVRRQQLQRASEAASWLVDAGNSQAQSSSSSPTGAAGTAGQATLSDCSLVLAGDLNFRVESEFVSFDDKQQGGKDFQTVLALAEGNVSDLKSLFRSSDRLHKLLVPAACDKNTGARGEGSDDGDKLHAAALPPLLTNIFDALGTTVVAADSTKPLFRPTLTYKPGAPPPRQYMNKRAPSWADRVLIRDLSSVMGSATSLEECKSLPHVICSDHEPVVAVFITQAL